MRLSGPHDETRARSTPGKAEELSRHVRLITSVFDRASRADRCALLDHLRHPFIDAPAYVTHVESFMNHRKKYGSEATKQRASLLDISSDDK